MRFVIYGAGAIGGVVGARLFQSGADVMLIARGEHRAAIAADGLTLITPDEEVTLPVPVAADPVEAGVGPGDVVLLATKSQDTGDALGALRGACPSATVVTMQNGVENERAALRLFSGVYGALVMVPTAHLDPGVVLAYGSAEITGRVDVGRYPGGSDALTEAICAALRSARFDSTARADVMTHKHAKLIANLNNAVQAVCGLEQDTRALSDAADAEGRAILTAAGIAFEVPDEPARFEKWTARDIPDHPRGGGSTWQSVTRGIPVESDFLNGEIVLQARLLGRTAPVNQALQQLARETVTGGHEPGWMSPDDVLTLARGLRA